MLIAWIMKNNKKQTVATKEGHNKEKFTEELNTSGVEFDGIDRILNWR